MGKGLWNFDEGKLALWRSYWKDAYMKLTLTVLEITVTLFFICAHHFIISQCIRLPSRDMFTLNNSKLL